MRPGNWPHFAVVFHRRLVIARQEKHQILSRMLLDMLGMVDSALRLNDMALFICHEGKEYTLDQWSQAMTAYISRRVGKFVMPEFIQPRGDFEIPEFTEGHINMGDFPKFSEVVAEMLLKAVEVGELGMKMVGATMTIVAGDLRMTPSEFIHAIHTGQVPTDRAIPDLGVKK